MVIRKALQGDIDSIHDVVRYYAERDILLARTKEDIAGALNTFLVAEDGNSFTGVISYYDYGEKLKEIRSLAVKPEAEARCRESSRIKPR
jgi:amino-acid N-acetyltransferase